MTLGCGGKSLSSADGEVGVVDGPDEAADVGECADDHAWACLPSSCPAK